MYRNPDIHKNLAKVCGGRRDIAGDPRRTSMSPLYPALDLHFQDLWCWCPPLSALSWVDHAFIHSRYQKRLPFVRYKLHIRARTTAMALVPSLSVQHTSG